jgi:hypothetical protein
MKTLHRRTMLLAAPFLASACSVLPERPYQEVLRYALEPRRQGEGWRGKGRRLLLLRTLRAPPALDVRGLRSIRPDGDPASIGGEATKICFCVRLTSRPSLRARPRLRPARQRCGSEARHPRRG